MENKNYIFFFKNRKNETVSRLTVIRYDIQGIVEARVIAKDLLKNSLYKRIFISEIISRGAVDAPFKLED